MTKLKDSELDAFQLQSMTIDLLRFPLTIMVIFIHMNPIVSNLINADFSILSGRGIYNIVGVIFSHVLSNVAVPAFFLISGFLFFVNFQDWSWTKYKEKMCSRIYSLVIPYILWNLVPFLITFIYIMLGGQNELPNGTYLIEDTSWHIFYDCNEWEHYKVNWLGDKLRMTGPYILSLWFLRDLIVVSCLSPLIYFAIRRFKIYVLLVLFFAFISRIWTLIPGFHINAFFFFTLGAYFALNRLNIIFLVNKYRSFLIIVCFILLILMTIFNGGYTVIGQNIYPFFILTGVFTSFLIGSICILKFNIRPNKSLVSSCFFIYAFHTVTIPSVGSPLGISKKIMCYVVPGSSVIKDILCFLFSPFVTVLICVFVLVIARRFLPQLTLFFSGNK